MTVVPQLFIQQSNTQDEKTKTVQGFQLIQVELNQLILLLEYRLLKCMIAQLSNSTAL